RLELVANTRRDCEVLADANVVLDVESCLQVVIRDCRIANPPRVVTRLVREKRLEIVEGVLAEIVGRGIRMKPAAVDRHTGPERMSPERIVEIGATVYQP